MNTTRLKRGFNATTNKAYKSFKKLVLALFLCGLAGLAAGVLIAFAIFD